MGNHHEIQPPLQSSLSYVRLSALIVVHRCFLVTFMLLCARCRAYELNASRQLRGLLPVPFVTNVYMYHGSTCSQPDVQTRMSQGQFSYATECEVWWDRRYCC
ncbi:hypothetical protein F4809DRAFT_627244 [Biscogniauxia mediterranea]|nr:hypothetical protein F4809DRAFT_627244 [Biscogniauxia mediterranea]